MADDPDEGLPTDRELEIWDLIPKPGSGYSVRKDVLHDPIRVATRDRAQHDALPPLDRTAVDWSKLTSDELPLAEDVWTQMAEAVLEEHRNPPANGRRPKADELALYLRYHGNEPPPALTAILPPPTRLDVFFMKVARFFERRR